MSSTPREGYNAGLEEPCCSCAAEKLFPSAKRCPGFVLQAYLVGQAAHRRVAAEGLPARLQEQALVGSFAAHSDEVSHRYGRRIEPDGQKPYTGTHNGGYTECQEFCGAITLDSDEPLGRRIVTMLKVAVRGVGDHWHEEVIPDLDCAVPESTLGKFGPRVENLSQLPLNVQPLVGSGL